MSKKTVLIGLGVVSIVGLGFLYQTVPPESEIRKVSMINNDGQEIGIAQLTETKAGVLLDLKISGLTPNGEHAIHIHEKGDCAPIDSFKNAGGHYNPMDKKHGMKHPEGQHAGDMPNLKPDAKGSVDLRILNRQVTLGSGTDERATVFDADGSSIMIHAGADDHMSQPSGAAGGRIVCGVVK